MAAGTLDIQNAHFARARRRLPNALVCALVAVLVLTPFFNAAFHIDDTLFLRLAEQIRSHPFATYDFEYNWNHEPQSFWEVTQNPPLDGYLLAAAEFVVG